MRNVHATLALVALASLGFLACNSSADKPAAVQVDPLDQKVLAIIQPVSDAIVEAQWVHSHEATEEASYRQRGAQPPPAIRDAHAFLASHVGFRLSTASSGPELREEAKTYLVQKSLETERKVKSLERDALGIEGPAKKLHIENTHTAAMRIEMEDLKAVLVKIQAATAALDALK